MQIKYLKEHWTSIIISTQVIFCEIGPEPWKISLTEFVKMCKIDIFSN